MRRQRATRAVILVAGLGFVLVLTCVLCLLVAVTLSPDATHWLLSGGDLLD